MSEEPKRKPGPGRPPSLTRVVDRAEDGSPITAAEKVVNLTREIWAPWEYVAKAAGLAPGTLNNWVTAGGKARAKLARGEKITPYERQYVVFLDSLEKAEGDAVAARLGFINQVAAGGWTKTKRVEKTTKDGDVEVTVTTETADPVWQAAAWQLERRRHDLFGRSRIEVTGADGAPLVPKEDRAEELAQALEAWQAGVEAGKALVVERNGTEANGG